MKNIYFWEMLTFDEKIQTIAFKLRGMYLDMCCDLEFTLADILVTCLVKDEKDRKSVKEIFLETAQMSKKISMVEIALERYNPSYYKEYEDCFKKIKELNGWRNKFAHSMIRGDINEKDLSFITFTFIKDSRLKERNEEVNPLIDKLISYAPFVDRLEDLKIMLEQQQYNSLLNKDESV